MLKFKPGTGEKNSSIIGSLAAIEIKTQLPSRNYQMPQTIKDRTMQLAYSQIEDRK